MELLTKTKTQMKNKIFTITSRIMFLTGLLLLTASALMVGARTPVGVETTLQSQNIAKDELPDPCLIPDVYCETVEVSCYTGWESHGANGRVDGVSVATYLYPQGTWLEIEGIGKRRVDTVTAERFAHRIDVWWNGDNYNTYLDCLDFGTQLRKVTVIE